MEIPNHCMACKMGAADCVLLFKASRTKKVRNKRFILNKCPCKDCLVLTMCVEECIILKHYIRKKNTSGMIDHYLISPVINWHTRKRI